MSDEFEDSYEEFEEQPSGGSGSGGNRNFVIAIVAVIVVFVVLIVGIGGFYFLTRGGSSNNSSGERGALAGTQAAMIYTQNAQTAAAATKAGATEIARNLLPTETPVPPTSQALAATSVVAFPTGTPAPTVINAQASTTAEITGTAPTAESSEAAQRTATIAVLLTQVAASGGTPVAGLVGPLTPTALPQTGFMDEIGLPVLLGMTMLFIFIIFMARRLRVSANR